MTDNHDPELDDEQLDPTASAAPVTAEDQEVRASVLSTLRATFNESVADAREVFDVEPRPGVAIRYRYVGGAGVTAVGQKLRNVRDPSVQATYAACETLILACDEIVCYGADGNLLPLVDPTPEQPDPIRFDARLAEVLGLPANTSPRRLVLMLFKQNEWAVRQQARAVSAWLDQAGAEATEELSGK